MSLERPLHRQRHWTGERSADLDRTAPPPARCTRGARCPLSLRFLLWGKRTGETTSTPSTEGHLVGAPTRISSHRVSVGSATGNLTEEKVKGPAVTTRGPGRLGTHPQLQAAPQPEALLTCRARWGELSPGPLVGADLPGSEPQTSQPFGSPDPGGSCPHGAEAQRHLFRGAPWSPSNRKAAEHSRPENKIGHSCRKKPLILRGLRFLMCKLGAHSRH